MKRVILYQTSSTTYWRCMRDLFWMVFKRGSTVLKRMQRNLNKSYDNITDQWEVMRSHHIDNLLQVWNWNQRYCIEQIGHKHG